MTEQEKEIQAIHGKYAKKMLKDCKNMTVEEEKQYIRKWQPIMDKEIEEVIKKYKDVKK